MSHGTKENIIFDSNNQQVDLADIEQLLSPRSFTAMKYKPKLMIVQACSGSKLAIKVQVKSCLSTTGWTTPH